jgi:hypothetical protein
VFEQPVLAHAISDDPVLVYGNQAALELWGYDWDDFTSMPSRLTAEPDERADRAAVMAEVARTGWSSSYSGVRVRSDGRRFRIVDATVWNVLDDMGGLVGQAATFTSAEPLDH